MLQPIWGIIGLNSEQGGQADIDLRVGLIEDIPFPDGQFDVVLSSFMISHMAEETRRRGLAEVRRVLKPGGRFLVVDFEPPTPDGT